MSSLNRLVLDLSIAAGDLRSRLNLDDDDPRPSLRRLSDYLRGFAGGFGEGTVTVNTGATKATATLTFTNDPTGDETFTLCNVVFTGKASGASGDEEWNITAGGSNAADAAGNAASVAALVNAHPTLSKFITASSALGVVTFTCDIPGDVGNGLQLSESLTNATISGFATVDTGDDGTEVVLSLL